MGLAAVSYQFLHAAYVCLPLKGQLAVYGTNFAKPCRAISPSSTYHHHFPSFMPSQRLALSTTFTVEESPPNTNPVASLKSSSSCCFLIGLAGSGRSSNPGRRPRIVMPRLTIVSNFSRRLLPPPERLSSSNRRPSRHCRSWQGTCTCGSR